MPPTVRNSLYLCSVVCGEACGYVFFSCLEVFKFADNLTRVLSLKDITTADQHVNASLNKPWCCLILHAAIHLYQCMRVLLFDKLPKPLHFFDGVLDELLSAKPRVDTHQQHEFHIADNVLEHTDRRRRVQRDACFHTSIVYLLYGAVQMCTGLIVHVHHHRAQSSRLLNVLFGMNNHEVHVERFLTKTCHSLEHRKAERDVRHEHPVHYVQMKPVGLAPVNHLNVVMQVQEIGSQQ